MSNQSFGITSHRGSPRIPPAHVLKKHERRQPKVETANPAPGQYDIDKAERFKFKTTNGTLFGGQLARVDRSKTGPQAEAYRRAQDPDPARYASGAASGLLRTSGVNNAGAIKFGTSSREANSKTYMSPMDTGFIDVNSTSKPGDIPGPGNYDDRSALLKVSNRPRSPVFSFGVRTKSNEMMPSTSGNVGPGTYTTGPSLGKHQPVSTRTSAPKFSMGSSSRSKSAEVVAPGFSPVSRAKTPSPDKYNVVSALGKEVRSTQKTAASFSFGARLEKGSPTEQSKFTPGPGAYDWYSTIGVQSVSKFRSSAGFSFGTSDRS